MLTLRLTEHDRRLLLGALLRAYDLEESSVDAHTCKVRRRGGNFEECVPAEYRQSVQRSRRLMKRYQSMIDWLNQREDD